MERMTKEEFNARHNMKVATDIIIFTVRAEEPDDSAKAADPKLQVLLIKRKGETEHGKWAIPGGAVANDEDVDTAAYRELVEETNIDNIYIEQLYTWGAKDRDPRAVEDRQNRAVSVSYLALVDSKMLDIQAGDDAADAQWFTINSKLVNKTEQSNAKGFDLTYLYELQLSNANLQFVSEVAVSKEVQGSVVRTEISVPKSGEIAFDHAKILHYALERLCNKVEYTNIVFNLMPERFTLAELKEVYETILHKTIGAAAFTERIKHMVVKTGEYSEQGKLYRFNPAWIKGLES